MGGRFRIALVLVLWLATLGALALQQPAISAGSIPRGSYRGIPVLSAYLRTSTDGFTWAVLAEIDEQEVLEIAADDRPAISAIMLFLYALSL